MITKTELSKIINIPEEHIEFKDDMYHVIGDVYITDELVKNGELKVNFGYIAGSFYCNSGWRLKASYKVTPFQYLNSDILDIYNYVSGISSIDFAYEKVVYNEKLKTLKGCPLVVEGTFNCSNNDLINLDYLPKSVHKNIFCSNNKIKVINQNIENLKINLYKNPYFYFKKFSYKLAY